MGRRKKASLVLVCAGLVSVLLVSLVGLGLQPIVASPESITSPQSPQDKIVAPAPPTVIPGVTYTGLYIRIGLNKGGTFGRGGAYDPGCGFQFPIGRQYESLAIWWWGEGYVVAYKVYLDGAWRDRIAYWWPSLGWPPPAKSRIVSIYAKQLRNDTNTAIWEVRVQTIDKALNMTFKFSFPKPQKYVLLETKITNNGEMGKVRDVLYKRIVDWDIHWDTGNMWTNDAHAAYASYFNTSEGRTFVMSVAGYTSTALDNEVCYVDLDAWDDIDATGVGVTTRDPGNYDIQSHHEPLYFDGNAAIYYDLGEIAKGTTKTVMTVYQAGWNWLGAK